MLQTPNALFLNAHEAAGYLRLSAGRIRQLRLADRFPHAVKIGRDWLIPTTDLDAIKVYRKPGRPKKEQDDESAMCAPAGG